MAENPEIGEPLRKAKELLKEYGYPCEVSEEDLVRWFQAETPYPDIGLEEVLKNPLLVVHELVEIDAVKRMGLTLVKDVIVKNLERVEEAHYEAARVELELAAATGNLEHIGSRVKNIKNWSEDPLVVPELKRKYRELYSSASQLLGGSEPTPEGPR